MRSMRCTQDLLIKDDARREADESVLRRLRNFRGKADADAGAETEREAR